MRIDRLIVKTVVSTLIATLILLVAMFGILSLCFPQTMMKITYSMGFDKSSVNFSVTAYERFGMAEYAGYGADVALQANLHGQAESCIESLIANERFDAYCDQRNEQLTGEQRNTTMQAYYRRQLCLSIYWQGDGERAVNRALELMGDTFAAGNPLVEVIRYARIDSEGGDATVRYALAKMVAIQGSDAYARYAAEDKAYFEQVVTAVDGWFE